MPWIPFGKFILPLCQVSLIYVKAVRQHHWFRRLTLIRFIEQESSCFSQITEAHRAVLWSSHFWDATRRNVSFSESFRKSPWIGETAESWMDEHYPIFMGWLPSDKFWRFGQCTNVTWKRMCTQLLKFQWRAWGDAHLEKSTAPVNLCWVSPGAWQQALLCTGRGRSGVSRAAGMQGLWSLHGAGRRETEVWLGTHMLERHGILKDMLLSSAVQEAGTQNRVCGRGRSWRFPELLLFLSSVELMAEFPHQLFPARFWFPWKSPSAPASSATSCPGEALEGIPAPQSSSHRNARSGIEGHMRTRATQTDNCKIVPHDQQ